MARTATSGENATSAPKSTFAAGPAGNVVIAGPAASKPSPTPRSIVRIGVELPLAGDDGADGLAAWQGVQLALERWNADRSHVRVEAVFRDTSRRGHVNPHQDEGLDNVDDPTNGAAIVREFAADPRIIAVIGALRTNVAAAEAPLAHAFSLPIVSVGATNDGGAGTGGDAPAFFRIAANDSDEGAFAGTIARRRGYRSVAIIERSERSPRDVARGFARVFPAPAPQSRRADALLYAAPLERGTFLVPRAAAALLSDDERRRMARRGYSAPATSALYDRIQRAPLLDPPRIDAVRARYRARFGLLPSVDALDAYVATEAALAAVERATNAAGSTAVAAARHGTQHDARALTLAALRSGSLSTSAGTLGFTRDGGPLRSCFFAVSLRNGREAERFRSCRNAVFP